MKITGFLLFITPCFLYAESQTLSLEGTPSDLTLTFNIHLSNLQDTTAHTSMVSAIQQNATQVSHQEMPLQQSTMSRRMHMGRFIIPCIGIGILGIYGYACYTIIRGNYYLNQSNMWSSWRNDLSFDEFLALPQHEIANQLVQEINRRYYTSRAMVDLLTPLTSFMQHIDAEEQAISHYLGLYRRLERYKLLNLFPANHARYKQAPERLQRISYLKNVIRTWSSQYAFEQAQRQRTIEPSYIIPAEKKISHALHKRYMYIQRIMQLRDRLHGIPEYR